MQEIWRDVPNYDGDYQISPSGNIKSLKFGKEIFLKPSINIHGYLKVNLSIHGEKVTFRIHQLVAFTFMNHTPKKGIVVDHIDNNKLNNHVNNLQIITHRENASKDKFRRNSSSKYIGVRKHKASNKWTSQIQIDVKIIHLGLFKDELDAAKAYQNKLKEITED